MRIISYHKHLIIYDTPNVNIYLDVFSKDLIGSSDKRFSFYLFFVREIKCSPKRT